MALIFSALGISSFISTLQSMDLPVARVDNSKNRQNAPEFEKALAALNEPMAVRFNPALTPSERAAFADDDFQYVSHLAESRRASKALQTSRRMATGAPTSAYF
jgi:hypothetical protein